MNEPIHPDDVADRIRFFVDELESRKGDAEKLALEAGRAEADYRTEYARAFLKAKRTKDTDKTAEARATSDCEELLFARKAAEKVYEAHRDGNRILSDQLSAMQSLLRWIQEQTR